MLFIEEIIPAVPDMVTTGVKRMRLFWKKWGSFPVCIFEPIHVAGLEFSLVKFTG